MSVLIRNDSYSLTNGDYDDIEEKISANLQGRVEAAYFFGSFASKTFNRNSDIDLILVVKSDKKFTERAIEFADILDLFPRIDILVYTPQEFKNLTVKPEGGFWQSVVATMRKI